MEQALHLLLAYRYFIFVPLTIIEGPIATVLAGFLVTLGYMDIFLVYTLALLGDFIGDSLLYGFGRWGKNFIRKYGHYIGAGKEKLDKAKTFFAQKHTRAVVMSKLFHGVGSTGLVAAGVLAIPYRRFIRTCFMVTVAQSAVFLFVGIVFGHAYESISHYLDLYASTIGIIVVLLIVSAVLYKMFKR